MMYQPHLLQDFRFQKSELSSDEKKQAIKQQSERLGKLQMELQRSKLPVIVLVEGWGTSGKGTQIASMIQELDPRFFQVISLSGGTGKALPLPPHQKHPRKRENPVSGFRVDGRIGACAGKRSAVCDRICPPSGGNPHL